MIYIIISYLAFVLIFSVFSYFALYHIWRFGFVGDITKRVIYGYILMSIAIVVFTLILIIVV